MADSLTDRHRRVTDYPAVVSFAQLLKCHAATLPPARDRRAVDDGLTLPPAAARDLHAFPGSTLPTMWRNVESPGVVRPEPAHLSVRDPDRPADSQRRTAVHGPGPWPRF